MTDINAELEKLGMRAEMWPVDKLLEISKGTKNPKKHFNDDIAALTAAIKDVGFKGFVYINKDGTKIPAGNGRILAASRAGLTELPVIRILDLDKAKLKKFSLGDNKLRSEKYDENILLEILGEIKQSGEMFDYLGYDKYNKMLEPDMAAAAEAAANFEIPDVDIASTELYRAPGGDVGGAPIVNRGDGQPLALVQDMPGANENTIEEAGDILFPSDNEYDVPTLSLKFMAESPEMPFVKWGEISRKARMGGTWHFYVDDPKFVGLWKDPRGPLYSGATCCTEINFSTSPNFPKALALADIYKKRWIARYWQSRGMKIIVDVNVDAHLYDIAMLGVPDGWKSYSTRGQTSEIHTLDAEFEMAAERAGTEDIMFLVYGGGQQIKDKCAKRGWLHIPERMGEVSSGNIGSGLGLKVAPEEYQDLSS